MFERTRARVGWGDDTQRYPDTEDFTPPEEVKTPTLSRTAPRRRCSINSWRTDGGRCRFRCSDWPPSCSWRSTSVATSRRRWRTPGFSASASPRFWSAGHAAGARTANARNSRTNTSSRSTTRRTATPFTSPGDTDASTARRTTRSSPTRAAGAAVVSPTGLVSSPRHW